MAFWKIKLFHLPSNSEGKRFVDELTEVIDCWLSDSPSRTFPLKRCMLLPNLPLQKSSNKLKTPSRGHIKNTRTLERGTSKLAFKRIYINTA